MDSPQRRITPDPDGRGAEPGPPREHPVQRGFEAVLWSSRLVVLAAVLGSLVASLAMFYLATADTASLVRDLFAHRASHGEGAKEFHDVVVAHVVAIVDGYLLATILLIFAFGLYELFVSKLDVGRASESSSSVLVIRSLDDLKNRLAKVILMILIVTFFEHVLRVRVEQTLELLYVAGGIALVGLALYLAHAMDRKEH